MGKKGREQKNVCALVLGGGLNGYNIVRELYENGVENLILFDRKKNFAFCSRRLIATQVVPPEEESLCQAIRSLYTEYELIVIYPISDMYVKILCNLYSDIRDFCYVGFNPDTVNRFFNKSDQYAFCKKHNIAHPKTISLTDYMNSQKQVLAYPLLIKPDAWSRNSMHLKLFKTLVLNSEAELKAQTEKLSELMRQGVNLLVTEVVPGDDDTVYGYVAYRSKAGEILNEWTWRKLSQCPEGFGVFSTISNQGTNKVRELGREIFQRMDLQGINEIEFKYDSRDDQYKYIETNFRTPMLIRLGRLTGVDVCYTQYLDAMEVTSERQTQIQDKDIHYVLFQSELQNLIARPGYIKKFFRNIFHSDKTYFAIFDPFDVMPTICNFAELCRALIQKVTQSKLR